jgi:peptidoglycan lytic transglycosylase
MKRSIFRTAQLFSSLSGGRLWAGALFAALVLSLSANGGGPKATSNRRGQETAKKAHHAQHWYQIGLASWYGGHFQGRTTAAGETYDMNDLTCAHPTLPMGTWLRVTNMHNRKTTYVRVNDRGPVVDGRIIDLSYAAANVIGLSGIGRVKLEQVHQNDPALAEALVARLQMPVLITPMGSPTR